MSSKTQHDYAVYLFQQGFYEDAVRHLDEVLQEKETADGWSDWATAQFALSHYIEAERGFRRALELNPEMVDAAVNFGTMLVSLNRLAEAVALLDGVLPKMDPEPRAVVLTLVDQCRAKLKSAPQLVGTR